jgi:catechol 2,3-dioxygenase-like lactoylglutathione lyase family enzyme
MDVYATTKPTTTERHMKTETNTIKTHLSLRVADVARSTKFYEAFFGQPPHKTRPGYANFDVANPPLKLALTQSAPQQGAGSLDHLGLLVSDTAKVLAAKERLQHAGLASFDEMNTTCCYARQDKFWVHDPDGVQWEVYAITDDMLGEHNHEHEQNDDTGQPEITCCRS